MPNTHMDRYDAESQKEHRDVVDVIIEAAHKVYTVPQHDGTAKTESRVDPEILWWKTGLVNSESYGRFAFELKEWERMAEECYYNMHPERAAEMAKTILRIGESYRRSIDAKSSESTRGERITQSTLLDKINRSKIEKSYKISGDKGGGGLMGFLRQKEQDDED